MAFVAQLLRTQLKLELAQTNQRKVFDNMVAKLLLPLLEFMGRLHAMSDDASPVRAVRVGKPTAGLVPHLHALVQSLVERDER